MSERTLHCYAYGEGDVWEAICLDLDIGVQGDSFDAVFRSLSEAIAVYRETVQSLPANDRDRLMRRAAPLSVRLRFLLHWLAGLFGERPGRFHHHFTMPLPA